MGLHTALYRATGGRLGQKVPGGPGKMLLLDHVGAKSGTKRTSPLLYVRDGDDLVVIASKGAAGVTGAGLAVLAGGLQSHRPDLLDGVGLIVGIDRFMSEARAVTNFSGNAVATLLVGTWTNTIDKEQVDTVLRGEDPFDETTMLDEDDERRMEARERGEEEPAHA